MVNSGVAVGIDLVQVSRIEASLHRFDQRFIKRLYTDHEIDYCTQQPLVAAERFASRFAAKEAALKVLRPNDVGVGWRSIEVQRAPNGFPELRLHGVAKQLADAAGFAAFALSMSHEGDYATAVVIATPSVLGFSRPEGQQVRAVIALSLPILPGEQVEMNQQIRAILREHSRLTVSIDSLADEYDLYKAGMTSQASVNVMLALEGTFDIEFPDHMLKRSVFASVAAIRGAVEELVAKVP